MEEDLAVEAILALCDAVFGPLTAPDTFRRHVTVIIEAAREIDTSMESEDRDRAVRLLRAYAAVGDLVT